MTGGLLLAFFLSRKDLLCRLLQFTGVFGVAGAFRITPAFMN
jgi:hypothetical protein